MLEKARNILLVISGMSALLSIYLKTMNSFAIDIIRNKYKNVPGKQPMFNTVIKFISYCFVGIYFVLFSLEIFDFFREKKWQPMIVNPIGKGGLYALGAVIGILIIILPIISAIISAINLLTIKDEFRKKLESNKYNKISNSTILYNRIGIVLSIIVTILWMILLGCIFKDGINVVNNGGKYIFQNNVSDENMTFIVAMTFLAIIAITSFIVLNSLKEMYTAVNQEESYLLKVNNYEIRCQCYLEYEEYFLIFEKGIERYIKKSEVKEIIKKNEIKVMSSENLDIIKNIKLFNKIHNHKLKKEYMNIREFVKQEYKSNNEYNNLRNINLEIERLNNYVKILNNPFISIVVSIVLLGIPLIIPGDHKNGLFVGVYTLILILVLGTLIININNKFMFAIISIDVLNELKKKFDSKKKTKFRRKRIN